VVLSDFGQNYGTFAALGLYGSRPPISSDGKAREGDVMSHVPMSVLVVEDEALLRLVTAEYLRGEGLEVFEAANADDAIVLLEARPSINVLFTDIDMPGSMDGLKLSATVRDRWPPIRIVVTSGQNHFADRDLIIAEVFCAKPYLHSELMPTFRRLIGEVRTNGINPGRTF
jgi:two-component system, response regulator PdtaR